VSATVSPLLQQLTYSTLTTS